jgi:SAM-dependent methyltransferase
MRALTTCPACNHEQLQAAFPGVTGDNSVAPLVGKPLPFELPGFDLAAHATSNWSVCAHCALMFARNRPDPQGLATWYPQLFQFSEERNYNTAVLPESYLAGKAKSAEILFADMQANHVLDSAARLIHFRCGPGHVLHLAKSARLGLEVYGLEYFEHPARHARQLVGEDRVAIIDVPEPVQPFDVKRFDVILSNHFLTHAHNPSKLLRYYHSLLSDDGKLLIYNEQDHDLSLKSMTAYARGINFFHNQLFTADTLSRFLLAHGFACRVISTAKPGKKPKYATLLCTKVEAQPMPRGNAAQALALLRSWKRKHELYQATKPIIDPVRKLLRHAR